MKKSKFYSGLLAAGLAGFVLIQSSPVVYACDYETKKDDFLEPGFYVNLEMPELEKSYCHVNIDGAIHKGKATPDENAIITMEDFGKNLVLLCRGFMLGEGIDSKNMYHLYMELCNDFGNDTMYKMCLERDGIVNLLQKMVDDGMTIEEAMNFIVYIDSNVYMGFGEDNFWYESIKEHKTDEDSKDDVLRPIEPNFDEHKRPPKHEKGKQKIKR